MTSQGDAFVVLLNSRKKNGQKENKKRGQMIDMDTSCSYSRQPTSKSMWVSLPVEDLKSTYGINLHHSD